jgi:hypothetical protein
MGASKQRRRTQYLENVLTQGKAAIMNYKKFCNNQLNAFSKKNNMLFLQIIEFCQLVLIPDFVTFLRTGFLIFTDGQYNGASTIENILNAANGLPEPEFLEKTDHDDWYLFSWSVRIVQMLKDKIKDSPRNQLFIELHRANQERRDFLEEIKEKIKEAYIQHKMSLGKTKDEALAYYQKNIIMINYDNILDDIMSEEFNKQSLKSKYGSEYDKFNMFYYTPTKADFSTYKKMIDNIDTMRYKLAVTFDKDLDDIMLDCIENQELFQKQLKAKHSDMSECYIDSDRGHKIAAVRLRNIAEKINKLKLEEELQEKLKTDLISITNYLQENRNLPQERTQSKSTRRKAWKSIASLRVVTVEYSDIDFDYSIF